MHLVFKFHPVMRLLYPSESIEAKLLGFLFGMTLCGSQFLSAVFFETSGIAPPECEQKPPDSRKQYAVGFLSAIVKGFAMAVVASIMKRDFVYVHGAEPLTGGRVLYVSIGKG